MGRDGTSLATAGEVPAYDPTSKRPSVTGESTHKRNNTSVLAAMQARPRQGSTSSKTSTGSGRSAASTTSSISGLYNVGTTLDQLPETDKCVVTKYFSESFACGNTRSEYFKEGPKGIITFHNGTVSFLPTNDLHETGRQQFLGSGLETTLRQTMIDQVSGNNGTVDLLEVMSN